MRDILEIVRNSVLDRPDGALTLGLRYWLWNEAARLQTSDFHVRQAMFGCLICQDAAEVWDKLPLDATDRRLYGQYRELCENVSRGELGTDKALKRFNELDCHAHVLESVLALQKMWDGMYALRAVRRASLDLIRPTALPPKVDQDLSDADIDPNDFDVHFLTSCVAAHGAPWESSSSSDLRRTFWLNWLDKCFWSIFSSSSR